VAARLARHDVSGAAAEVVRALGPGLLGYLVAILRDEDDARDVLAEVAEHVLTALPRFRAESTVKTWTYRIAWRTAMHFRDDPHRRRATALRSSVAEGLVDEARSSTAAFRRTAAHDWLAGVRRELSVEDQSLLTLRLDRGMSWADVADVMGGGAVDQTALRKRFERIKGRLRAAAERDGVLER
jgi:RNA polymerase sigma-70 factor (ECF subfamily)